MSDINVIECNNITKVFNEGHEQLNILNGVNLTVKKGSQIAIMGRSGSGKTTLLQLLGGLDKPTSGTAKLLGNDYHLLSEGQRDKLRNKSLGFIYQFHHLLPEFSALENVAMPLLIRNMAPNLAMDEASAILEKVGLKDRLEHKPSELSGGERQRAAIARALVTKPDCVLADEPTGNLDEETREHIFYLMRELNQAVQSTLIIVTHDLGIAKRLDKTYALNKGILELV